MGTSLWLLFWACIGAASAYKVSDDLFGPIPS